MPEKIQFAPPRRRAAKRHCLAEKLPFRLRKSRRAQKNVKAIFLLGSVLNEQAVGLRFDLSGGKKKKGCGENEFLPPPFSVFSLSDFY